MSILSRLNTPIFKAEGMPKIDEETYRLKVWGLTLGEQSFSLADIKAMPFTRLNARLTSVSGFSIRANWDGVLWQDFVKNIQVMSQAAYVTFTSVGGYDTAIPLTELTQRVMLVYGVDGEPLEREYGGPLRMLVPHLWGYKSCKWVQDIEFHQEERGGFWEDRGYSRAGMIEPGMTLDINTRSERPIRGGGEVTEF
jgi:DMSO/TMAO reductase YedYZ molybdopterin-dependent catalytic subunit